jgi:hypothetical protein
MSRRARIALIAAVVILFLLVSGLLSRFLSVENAEREADLKLIQAQVAGNAQAMIDQLPGCARSPTCEASARANASRLRTHGAVKILQLSSATAYSLTGKTGRTRVAWTVIGKLPVVQCVLVKRSGNFLSGISFELLALSAPIPNETAC